MRVPAVGESAAQLPWLWPDAHSLTALAQPLSLSTWPTLRRDPAALALGHRRGECVCSDAVRPSVPPARFLEPRVLETARRWFNDDRGCWLDFRHPITLPIYRAALAIAHFSQIIAERTRTSDNNAAWTAGILTPLGWFAVAAIDPLAVAGCLSDPIVAENPIEAQVQHWGLDHASIVRRLARRWELPDWIRLIVGHLDLAIPAAASIGADPDLFAVVQLAVVMAEQSGYSLGLLSSIDLESLTDRLRLNVAELHAIRDRFNEVDFSEAFEPEWRDPRKGAELPAILNGAIDARRSETAPFLAPLEDDLDRLHKALRQCKNGEDERLRTAKLSALAEFAAGASHEINNPLAVISGHSQYLLHREIDERFRPALESIVRQTQRIHAILSELMQFARPPQLARKSIEIGDVIHAAVEACRGMADEAEVKLDCIAPSPTVWIHADPRHLQTAVGCLVRNAIEAAALDKGWARVRVETSRDGVEILVEDSGPGPTPDQCDHLFDPFYSGRAAGRGRGLGLPTAWRLAREHGGDVRRVPTTSGLTRFALSLPLSAPATRPVERLSA